MSLDMHRHWAQLSFEQEASELCRLHGYKRKRHGAGNASAWCTQLLTGSPPCIRPQAIGPHALLTQRAHGHPHLADAHPDMQPNK